MDINSLLSPQDSPRESASPVPAASPPRHRGKITNTSIRSSPLSTVQNSTSPPLSNPAQSMMPSHPLNSLQQQHRSSTSGSLDSSEMRPPLRQASTSGMDTLAELASMQQPQHPTRTNSGNLRSYESFESPQPVQQPVRPNLQDIARSHSGSKSSLDITMTDAPIQTPPPRSFSAPSLPRADLEQISQLMAHLAENSNAYESHVQLIKLLYHGFLVHTGQAPGLPDSIPAHPETYELLGDLRQAMEAMASRFSLGEDIWTARLQVQQATAKDFDDCLNVVELFAKAVTEEAGSARIWSAYGEWMLTLYSAVNPHDQAIVQLSLPFSRSIRFSEEEKAVIRGEFGKSHMMDVWQRGAEQTKYRIDKSHLVWNKYTELLLAELNVAPTPATIAAVKQHFFDRLETSHAAWDTSFQKFSTFTTTYERAELYEETMVNINRKAAPAKADYADREIFEIKLQRATEAEDKATEWTVFNDYLEWERLVDKRRKKNVNMMLCSALYERALLRFPSSVDMWEDFITFLGDSTIGQPPPVGVLTVLGRACDHCPWSGILWSQYITAAELANLSMEDIGLIKHKATSTGLLDVSGMEDVIKIYTAWCSFLRRQAFQDDADDEEHDVAHMGIRSAIEDTETLGEAKYGKDYQGDPQYRLDRIYIKFLSQIRNYNGARDRWQKLLARYGHSYEFWLRYYVWEMYVWTLRLNEEDPSTPRSTPKEATAVLKMAVKRTNLDWPEKIIETYLTHCEDHGDAADLQTAMVESRKASKLVATRRQREVQEQAEAQALVEQQQRDHLAATDNISGSKRKRDEGDIEEEPSSAKKTRPDDEQIGDDQSSFLPVDSAVKRDRENATVIIKNLPPKITDRQVRHHFNDCGSIKGIKVTPDEGGLSSTASIEFASGDEVLAALTRDGKSIDGNTVEVQVGTGSTIYVSNFPPSADEAYIRSIFSKFGEIVDIRFPSLRLNTHRRFCYVQFKLPGQAYAATELDGMEIEGNLKLLAKISDPAHKKERQGAMYEGRELYVANVDWSATEDDLKAAFSKFGDVERVRLPRKINGQSRGMAFIVYSTKEEADAGLVMDKTKIKSRIVSVEVAMDKASKRRATTVLSRASGPPHSDENGMAISPGSAGSPPPQSRPSGQDIAARSVNLLNVPDTVNDARIKALAEPYGDLVKVTLRPDHQGAVIEFKEASAAGKAALALEGHEIIPGRKLSTGTYKEMLEQKADRKVKEEVGKKPKNIEQKQMQPAGPIRRPAQAGGGRRGGLGLKRGGHAGASSAKPEEVNGNSNKEGPKSNADFKKMFAK